MDPRTARRLALLALGLGIVGDILFDRQALGINVPFAIATAMTAGTVVRPRGTRIDRLDVWLPPVGLLAAVGVALRTDPPIVALDVALATAATLAWLVAVSGQAVTRRSVDVVIAFGVWASLWLGFGGTTVVAGAARDGAIRDAGRWGRPLLPVLRGLALATPVVVVLGALLAGADDGFAAIVGRIAHLPFDLPDLSVRAVIVIAFAWIAAGALAVANGGLPFQPAAPGLAGAEPRSLGAAARSGIGDRTGWIALPGATEALVVLLVVDVLFGVFVAVQLGYLFGGLATVLGTGVTFSDYARAGYFELVIVVVLVGALLVVAEAAGGRSRAFLGAALALVGLTFVILASAAVRLGLYLDVYGWTELRFYVAASIAWLAIGGVTLAALIARDRIRWLVHGLAFAAVAVTLVVTAIGPQAFMAQQNLARAIDPSLVRRAATPASTPTPSPASATTRSQPW